MTNDAIRPDQRLQGWGIALFRIVLGAIFTAHGAQKLFQFGLEGTAGAFAGMGIPFPALSAALVTGVELLGGVALVLGLLTRLAALPLAATMAVALLSVHLPAGFFLPNGIEFTLALLAGTVAIALTGPGAWSLDAVVWRARGGDPVVHRLRKEREQVRAAA